MRFFKKIQDWIPKIRKNPKTGFAFLFQDLSDIMVRQRNRRIRFQSGFFGSFDAPRSERSWIDLFRKETQNPFSDSFGFKNPILDFLKERTLRLSFYKTIIKKKRDSLALARVQAPISSKSKISSSFLLH